MKNLIIVVLALMLVYTCVQLIEARNQIMARYAFSVQEDMLGAGSEVMAKTETYE